MIITGGEDRHERGRLLAAGCDTVLSSDFEADVLSEVIASLLEKRRETARLELKARNPLIEARLTDFVSESPAMQAFLDVVERVAPTGSSLLILGETGVGKERLARAIHAESPRGEGPFVAVNCAALPESLLESELFGHEEGAFTGATRNRRGWFELAHRGTIFLDEIGDVPFSLQAKLLRVLQDRCIHPLGGERVIPLDLRIIAATNRDLTAAVEEGTFRQDLFFRLSVVTLTLPPLRERKEDIGKLVENYITYYQEQIGREVESIEPEALYDLRHYHWPGNVREIMNVIERAVLLCRDGVIRKGDLPENIRGTAWTMVRPDGGASSRIRVPEAPDYDGRSLREVRKEAVIRAETAYLDAMLRQTRGRVGETALLAGIQPRALFEKMRKYGLRKEAYRRTKGKRSSRRNPGEASGKS